MIIITVFPLEINIIVDVFMGGDVFIIKYIYLLRVTKKVAYLILLLVLIQITEITLETNTMRGWFAMRPIYDL